MLPLLLLAATTPPNIQLARVPNGGIQPQVVQATGIVHLLYYSGPDKAGDLFYCKSKDEGDTWSAPVRVNTEPGAAIAAGTIRGGQMALGANGTVHVVWNGKSPKPKAGGHAMGGTDPLLYTHSSPDGTFPPARNLMGKTRHLDGGASVAADPAGGVYVVWHAAGEQASDKESDRQVFIARSLNVGGTFEPERPIWNEPTGACACCGLKALAADGKVWIAYRSAKQEVHRDSYLMQSVDRGKSFTGQLVSRWEVNACPMSSYWLLNTPGGLLAGLEETGAVKFFASPDGKLAGMPVPRPQKNGKYPVASATPFGMVLTAWTEGTAWAQGGDIRWQAYDPFGKPIPNASGQHPNPTPWTFPAIIAEKNGSFKILY